MPGLDPVVLLTTWERGVREHPLARAVSLLAAATGASRDTAATWDVGSRDACLAALLETTAGTVGWGCIRCTGCGELLDVPVDVAPLARSPLREPGSVQEIDVHGTAVSFRLPTTEDLQEVRRQAAQGADPTEARRLLLVRCVGPDVSDDVAEAVEAAMEDAASASAVQIGVSCAGCYARTTAALDVSVLLWAEVEARAISLLRDVHTLATAYGWTEPEVLALSPERRAAYLELVGR